MLFWLDIGNSFQADAGCWYMLYKDNYRLPADDKELKSSRPEFFQKPLRSIGIRGTDLVTDYFWEQLDMFMDPQAREENGWDGWYYPQKIWILQCPGRAYVPRQNTVSMWYQVWSYGTSAWVLWIDRRDWTIMESSKVYVNVMAEFTNDGRLLPRSFIWKDGHVYEIQKVTDVRRAASLKAGNRCVWE